MAQARRLLSTSCLDWNAMRCDVCGNDYDKAFEVVMGAERGVFDSFECAIHALAPVCAHCTCKVIGHGVEESGAIYCCAHCARAVKHGH